MRTVVTLHVKIDFGTHERKANGLADTGYSLIQTVKANGNLVGTIEFIILDRNEEEYEYVARTPEPRNHASFTTHEDAVEHLLALALARRY